MIYPRNSDEAFVAYIVTTIVYFAITGFVAMNYYGPMLAFLAVSPGVFFLMEFFDDFITCHINHAHVTTLVLYLYILAYGYFVLQSLNARPGYDLIFYTALAYFAFSRVYWIKVRKINIREASQ